MDTKGSKNRKKNPVFNGYTYKPMMDSSSALVKALVDLENYKVPDITSVHSLEYLHIEQNIGLNSFNSPNRFKKASENTDRLGKDFISTLSALSMMKKEDKEKERYKLLYGDTPEKKPSPKGIKKSPKRSPKHSPKQSPKRGSKQSPPTKDKEDPKKAKIKPIPKKY